MTPSGIEPATFRFVAQYLNHCATAVPNGSLRWYKIYIFKTSFLNFFSVWRTYDDLQARKVCVFVI